MSLFILLPSLWVFATVKIVILKCVGVFKLKERQKTPHLLPLSWPQNVKQWIQVPEQLIYWSHGGAGGVLETPTGGCPGVLGGSELLFYLGGDAPASLLHYLGLKLFLSDCVIVHECGILGNIWMRLEPSVLADVCQSDA